ncbi:MAG: DMT family transporter [Lachnospiraceae bacterium]|nr:DMT family transporter [Lachnospiraceae bacterium]
MLAPNQKGPLAMVAASICWSLGGLLIRFIPESWGALSIIGLRAFLAAIVFIIWRRSAKIELTQGNILAALCLTATTTLFVFANLLTTAAAAIMLQFTAPVFIILIHLVFYRKKPKTSEIIAATITICGMLLFFADHLEIGGTLGNVLAIISGLTFAGVFVCNKRPDTKPEQSLLLGFYISSLIGLPFAFFRVTPDFVGWASVIVLGVIQVGLAYVFFTIGIKKTTALLACLITAMEPVLNPLWVALVTGEIPGLFTILGGAIIILTIVIYNIWLEKKAPRS